MLIQLITLLLPLLAFIAGCYFGNRKQAKSDIEFIKEALKPIAKIKVLKRAEPQPEIEKFEEAIGERKIRRLYKI